MPDSRLPASHLHYEQRLDRVDQHAVFAGTSLRYNSWVTSRNCGEVPVIGDWNGDGKSDVGVFRTATHTFLLRGSAGNYSSRVYGSVSSIPVAGDWDGVSDLGVWDRTTGTFRNGSDRSGARRSWTAGRADSKAG